MASRGDDVAYNYILAFAWIGVVVAAVIDFFNARGELGRGVDSAADIFWALMNLLIAGYAILVHRAAWPRAVAMGSGASLLAVLVLLGEYFGSWRTLIGWVATLLNASTSLLHLFLQFKFFGRSVEPAHPAERSPQLLLLDEEKQRALAGSSKVKFDVAMNIMGRATAVQTSTQGSRAHYEAAIELLNAAWAQHSVEGKYQLALLYEGRYGETMRDPILAKKTYRELHTYLQSADYGKRSKEERRGHEKMVQVVLNKIANI